MKKVDLSTYDFDPEKKDYIHRAAMEKLLKEIKTLLTRNKKIRVTIENA